MPTGQQYVSTAPQTNLVGNINSSQGTATVVSFTGWPSTPFTGVWDIGTPSQEPVDVIGVSGNAITSMNRGIDGTSGQSHSNNATFTHGAIGRDFRESRAHIDASSSNDSTGHAVHGLTAGSSVVGTTDVQTLTNKTLTSPTINGMSAANASLTGTVTGAAQYQNITAGTTAVGSVPFTSKGLASQTADLLDVTDNVPNILFRVGANGATGAGATTVSPTDTSTPSFTVNAPSGTTANIQDWKINGVGQASLDKNGSLNLLTGPLAVTGLSGAVNNSRYVGSTAGGPPTTGTFAQGDYVVDRVYGVMWICVSAGTPGTWQSSGTALIASSVLGSAAGSVTFSSIPAYFNHLKLAAYGTSTATGGNGFDEIAVQFNGDTGNDYSYHMITMINSATVSGQATNVVATGRVGIFASGSLPSGIGEFTAEFVGYSSGKNKNWTFNSHGSSGVGAPNNSAVYYGGGVWSGTAAINSIKLQPASGNNFLAASAFYLYAW